MSVIPLAVQGAVLVEPPRFPDDRGFFVSPFQGTVVEAAVGAMFPVVQASYSTSRRGVVRGLHYTATPPGCAKYVFCPHGRALDVVLDVRIGSPTYGRWDSVVLDGATGRAVSFPVGVAHLFVALEDDTVMAYLLSTEYDPAAELALDAYDPELGLPLPGSDEAFRSERDRSAPTLARARRDGLLPYADVADDLDRVVRGTQPRRRGSGSAHGIVDPVRPSHR